MKPMDAVDRIPSPSRANSGPQRVIASTAPLLGRSWQTRAELLPRRRR
jgi:hypothetical protein